MVNETQRLKAILIENALYYDAQLNESRLRVFVSDLQDLSVEDVARAYTTLRREKNRRQMPLPGEIRAMLVPEQSSDEDQARNAVSRLIEAVAKFGWNNPSSARRHVGELAWLVVQREGGWVRICEELTDDNLPTLRAQWRDLAISLCRMSKAGKLHEAPSLPHSERASEISSMVRGAVKSLT